MVAEMMILAGEAVGSLGAAHDLPLPYRGQEAPQLPAQEVLDALPDGPCRGYALRRWAPAALHVHVNWLRLN
jgi:exoribonuclease-2